MIHLIEFGVCELAGCTNFIDILSAFSGVQI